jgi:hypothetical protein
MDGFGGRWVAPDALLLTELPPPPFPNQIINFFSVILKKFGKVINPVSSGKIITSRRFSLFIWHAISWCILLSPKFCQVGSRAP